MTQNKVCRCIRPLVLFALAATILVGLVGCGGGNTNLASGGIVGTGIITTASQGAISALGTHAITVNGQTFDTTGATVTINGSPSVDSALKIGMVVTVVNERHADGSFGIASVEYHAEVQGVVTGIDATARAFTVLGQRVVVDPLTVYDGGTFDALLGQVVEVSGFRSTPGDLLATLVIVKPTIPPTSATLQVTGVVGAFDGAARTFVIGLQLFDYSGVSATSVPLTLASGTTVRVGGTQASPTATLFANSIAVVSPTPPDAESIELEGLVTAFMGLGNFNVNGQVVDARNATIDSGSVDMIADGALVEVRGKVLGGIFVATTLEVQRPTMITLDGVVQAIDALAGSVTVGGQSVRVTSSTQLIDSSSAHLSNFSLAAVRVGDRLSILAYHADGALVATRLERFDAEAPPPDQPTTTIQGQISLFASIADFVVDGQHVNAGGAMFAGGTAGSLGNGVRVQVTGNLVQGVVVATRVQILPGSTDPATTTVTGTISGFVSVSNFTVAGQRVDASSGSFSNGTEADLANGRTVTVKGMTQGTTLVAQLVTFAQAPPTTLEVEGKISSFVGVSNFVVTGQKVNATQATISNGTAADLANGRQVHVKGVLQNGILIASSVQIEDSQEPQEIEVKGLVTNFVSIANFTVAGRTVNATNAKFDGGKATDLANGKKVQVQGTLIGTVLKATEIEFDD